MYIVFRKWKEMRKLGLPFMSPLVGPSLHRVSYFVVMFRLPPVVCLRYDTIRYEMLF